MLDQIMEDGMVNVAINAVVIFEDGTSEGSLGVENSADNQYYMRVELTKDDDGTLLYKSKGTGTFLFRQARRAVWQNHKLPRKRL